LNRENWHSFLLAAWVYTIKKRPTRKDSSGVVLDAAMAVIEEWLAPSFRV
jgi:hypothetical protein